MSGRKDRYSPHLGSPQFERAPPTSSNWRNKVDRRRSESQAADPSCVWTQGVLANLLYSDWANLTPTIQASWASCPYYTQCSLKARFILQNLDEFDANYWVFETWPRAGVMTPPIGSSGSSTGGVGKIDCTYTYPMQRSGWIFTYHRDLTTLQPPSLSNMYYAKVMNGTQPYSWEDSPVPAGTWKTRICEISWDGAVFIDQVLKTATVT